MVLGIFGCVLKKLIEAKVLRKNFNFDKNEFKLDENEIKLTF